jgi:putative PIN family toxin of toxin-antitoxin system
MRIVADTNTVISGMLWYGPPRHIFDAARQRTITLYTSDALVAEVRDVLARPKFAPALARNRTTAELLATDYTALAIVVVPVVLPRPIAVDQDDDAMLACAIAARADAIVSGDHHLLDLQAYDAIPILIAPALLALIDPSASPA